MTKKIYKTVFQVMAYSTRTSTLSIICDYFYGTFYLYLNSWINSVLMEFQEHPTFLDCKPWKFLIFLLNWQDSEPVFHKSLSVHMLIRNILAKKKSKHTFTRLAKDSMLSFSFIHLFTCVYIVWAISPTCLLLPSSTLPLISNFVQEKT
jgi:hypothetical protein